MSLKKIFVSILVFYFLIFLILPHTEYQPADPGIKILQIKDFILSGYSNFFASYLGRELDPSLTFFPTKPPFGYIVADNPYYVFPFFVTIAYTPFYLLGGIYALDLLSLISGLLIVFLLYKISNLLEMSETFQKSMILFLGFGSINSIYSFMFGESIHASLFITFAFYLILKSRSTPNSFYFLIAGLISGLSVLFRIELAFFCFLFLLGIFIFQMYKSKLDLILLCVGFGIPAFVLIIANYKVTGNILGLRGIEFLNYSGASYPIEKRLFNLVKALFVSDKGLGLFTAWPVFLFLIPYFSKFKMWKEKKELNFILFVSIVFSLLIPLIVKNDDGSILGPRFASSVQPLLIVGTFYSIQLLADQSILSKWISKLSYFIYYSIAVTILGYIILFFFLKASHKMNIEIDKKISGEVIFISKPDYFSLVFPSVYRKPILSVDSEEEFHKFCKNNRTKIPNMISIVTSNPKYDISTELEYKLVDSFSSNGIHVYNFKSAN